MKIREDIHRGKIPSKWNIQRCDQNRVKTRGKQRLLWFIWRVTWKNVHRMFGREFAWVLLCALRGRMWKYGSCWRWFWRYFETLYLWIWYENFTRMGTNLERARRILGITTRPMSTEDLVLIASPDRCKWWLAMLRTSQRRSMKQE